MINETPKYLAWLTPKIRFDKNISDKAKLIYAELCSLSTAYGYAFPSNEFLAELYGVNTRTITRILSELSDNNYIKITVAKNKKGSLRKIYILENSSGKIEEKENKMEEKATRQKCLPPLDKNVHTHPTKMSSAIINNNTSNNNTSINKERYIDSKNNIDSQETKKEKISLSISKDDVINLSKENNLDTDVSEKFYYYYKSRNWKVNNNFEINKNNLKANLLLWHKREIDYLENQKINNTTTAKVNKPDWIQEYLDEIKDLNPVNKNMI